MARLYDKYTNEILPTLGEKFGRTNKHSLPKLTKVVMKDIYPLCGGEEESEEE